MMPKTIPALQINFEAIHAILCEYLLLEIHILQAAHGFMKPLGIDGRLLWVVLAVDTRVSDVHL